MENLNRQNLLSIGISYDAEKRHYFCYTCNKYITRVQEHVNSIEHKQEQHHLFDGFRNDDDDFGDDENVEDVDDIDDDVDGLIDEDEQGIRVPNGYYCVPCNEQVVNVQRHIQSQDHKDNMISH